MPGDTNDYQDVFVVTAGSGTAGGGHSVTVAAGTVQTGLDFGNHRVVEAEADRFINEGEQVDFHVEVSALSGDLSYQWTALADNGEVLATGDQPDFSFTPANDGR